MLRVLQQNVELIVAVENLHPIVAESPETRQQRVEDLQRIAGLWLNKKNLPVCHNLKNYAVDFCKFAPYDCNR